MINVVSSISRIRPTLNNERQIEIFPYETVEEFKDAGYLPVLLQELLPETERLSRSSIAPMLVSHGFEEQTKDRWERQNPNSSIHQLFDAPEGNYNNFGYFTRISGAVSSLQYTVAVKEGRGIVLRVESLPGDAPHGLSVDLNFDLRLLDDAHRIEHEDQEFQSWMLRDARYIDAFHETILRMPVRWALIQREDSPKEYSSYKTEPFQIERYELTGNNKTVQRAFFCFDVQKAVHAFSATLKVNGIEQSIFSSQIYRSNSIKILD